MLSNICRFYWGTKQHCTRAVHYWLGALSVPVHLRWDQGSGITSETPALIFSPSVLLLSQSPSDELEYYNADLLGSHSVFTRFQYLSFCGSFRVDVVISGLARCLVWMYKMLNMVLVERFRIKFFISVMRKEKVPVPVELSLELSPFVIKVQDQLYQFPNITCYLHNDDFYILPYLVPSLHPYLSTW